MTVEAVIHQSLEYANAAGWDRLRQDELAACVVCRVRPDWSDSQALSAVDWVRSLSACEQPSS